MSKVDVGALTIVAGSLDYNGYPEAGKKVRAAADELALARAVVEAADTAQMHYRLNRDWYDEGLDDALAAYRAKVGSKG